MKYVSVFGTVLFVLRSVLALESIPIPNSSTPDGHFSFMLLAPAEPGAIQQLQLNDTRSKGVVSTIPIGGYASYPLTANKENLSILWSPKASYVAIQNRDTKRTWEIRIYSFDGTTLTPLDIPGFTQFALEQIQQTEIFRFAREIPVRWIDDQSLIVEVTGDCGVPPEVIRYQGVLSVSVGCGKISASTPLTTEREEG